MPAASRLPLLGRAATLCALAVASGAVDKAAGAVSGTIVNATTGDPAVGVSLTLSTFQGGMRPIEETISAAGGAFTFTKELPPTGGQPFAGSIRAELDGVGYTQVLQSDSSHNDVNIVVYSASADDLPDPNVRLLILEPSGDRTRVRESYQFINLSEPPVTYSSEDGTLRFRLPPGAADSIQVSGMGPAGMALQSTALPTGEAGLYKVDFPLKPGTNTLTLTYFAPRTDDGGFTLQSIYTGVRTSVAVPSGVSLAGEDIALETEHPESGALIYSVPDQPETLLTLVGEGALSGGSSSSSSTAQISIEPAPIASELPWIIGLTLLILGVTFAHFLTAGNAGGSTVGAREEDTRAS